MSRRPASTEPRRREGRASVTFFRPAVHGGVWPLTDGLVVRRLDRISSGSIGHVP